MTPRDRVLKALRFQEPDAVPYQITFTEAARDVMTAYYGTPDFEKSIGNHLANLSIRKLAPWTQVAPGHFRDEWGVVWNRTEDRDIGVVENQVMATPCLEGFEIPDAEYPGLRPKYEEFIDQNQDKFRIATIGMSLFERTWMLRGMEQILTDMLDNPDFLHDLFDRIAEYHLAQVEIALSYDVDCVAFGDDWGGQSGLMMGPALWREFVRPRAAKLYRRVREAGKYVMIHSCGNISDILPDLADMGVNIVNPFQPEALDVFETKRRFHGRLLFYGGISIQRLLPYGTVDDVRRETTRLLQVLGEGGGYIASPSHALPGGIPPENVDALIGLLRTQGME